MRKRLLSSLLLVVSLLCHAQESLHYSNANGLSGSDVTAFCEDDNYLWIGTNEGLNRFDGKKFKVFRKNVSDINSLKENNIETLMMDSRGYLWIGLKTGGVDIYNPRKDAFIHIGDIMEDPPQRVVSLLEDSKGNIWLGSWEQGLYQLSPCGDGDPFCFRVSRHYQTSIISDLVEYPEGRLWVGTYYGYFVYDLDRGVSVEVEQNTYSVTQFSALPGQDALLFSTWENGVRKAIWNPDTERYEDVPCLESRGAVYRMFPSGKDEFLLGTWGGGVKMWREGTTLVDSFPVTAPVVLAFYRDRHSRLWVGTYGNGLYCIPSGDSGLISIGTDPLHGKSITAILPVAGDNLLLGTQGEGLFSYDLPSGRFSGGPVDGRDQAFNRYILSLYGDGETVIVGDDDGGFLFGHPESEGTGPVKLKRVPGESRFGKITAVHRGAGGKYWFGTKQGGLYSARYEAHSDSFEEIRSYEILGTDVITRFVPSGDSRLWVSTYGGLFLFDTISCTAERVGGDDTGLLYDMVDDGKDLWLGTSDGLRRIRYLSGSREVEAPDFGHSIPEGPVTGLVLDRNQRLWFSTNMRIFVYSIGNQRLQEVNPDKFPDDSYYSAAVLPPGASAGDIVFGGTSHLLFIDSGRLLSHDDASRIILSDLQIDGQPVRVGTVLYGKEILSEAIEYTTRMTLPYQSQWIRFAFSEIGSDVYYNSYQYLVEGLEENWVPFDVSNPLTFSRFPPGTYSLCVRPGSLSGTNPDSTVWRMQIHIPAPWWKTAWFKAILSISALLATCCLMAIIFLRYRRKQRREIEELEKRQREEVLREKDSFLSGLSHDLLTSCSLILAPVKDLLRDENINEDQRERLDIISKNADFLSEIFNTIRDYRSSEMGDTDLKLKRVDLVSFTGMAVSAFDYLARSKGQSLIFSSELETWTVQADTLKLERILYNLIGNAVKYTGNGGVVRVMLSRLREDPPKVRIRVEDNGIGIADPKHIFQKYYRENENGETGGLGLGLYTAKQFVQAMGGTISVTSERGKGSVFDVEFPEIAAEADPPSEELTEGGDFVVLLVEDNDQMREYLSRKFSRHFEVQTASNGVQAMEMMAQNLPELVVSDVMMPDMDGLELCRTIKSSPLYADVFVILLSARTLPEDEVAGYKAGADFYMKKPFDPDILVSQIQNVYTTRLQRKKQIVSQLTLPGGEDREVRQEDVFLNRACEVVYAHLEDEQFSVDDLAEELHVSKAVLYRKFKFLFNDSPNVFIRNLRLKKAAELLLTTDLSVSEIGYMTGFSLSHYFIRRFKELYHETPKNYRKKNSQ